MQIDTHVNGRKVRTFIPDGISLSGICMGFEVSNSEEFILHLRNQELSEGLQTKVRRFDWESLPEGEIEPVGLNPFERKMHIVDLLEAKLQLVNVTFEGTRSIELSLAYPGELRHLFYFNYAKFLKAMGISNAVLVRA